MVCYDWTARPCMCQKMANFARTCQACTSLRRHFCTVWPQADPVDPKPQLEEECHAPCKKHWDAYLACEQRIAKAGKGQCQDWAFDYWGCLDKCVCAAKRLVMVCCGVQCAARAPL